MSVVLRGARIGRNKVVGKLDELAGTVDRALEQQVEVVRWDPEVTDKRQRFFSSLKEKQWKKQKNKNVNGVVLLSTSSTSADMTSPQKTKTRSWSRTCM